jgi:hypothetical protein
MDESDVVERQSVEERTFVSALFNLLILSSANHSEHQRPTSNKLHVKHLRGNELFALVQILTMT